MKKLLSFCLSIVMIVVALFSSISAMAEENVIYVTSNNGTVSFYINYEEDFTYILRDVLSYCDEASEENPFTIILPSGQHNIEDNLFLRSNTTLDMTAGTVLNLNKETGTNIFKNLRHEIGYDDLVNFNMIGGTLRYTNSFQSTSCLIRMTHASNVLFENVSFIGNGYAHCMELAACKDLTFKNCSFIGEVTPQKISGEALQIDILDPNHHFANMGGPEQYDYTMNDNITVDGCTFKNVRRGVGTQSIFVGYYQNNIKIINNTFDKVDEAAISCSNYINSTISNNKITNAGWGIKYTMMKSTDYLSDVCFVKDSDGKDVYGKANTNCNSVISNNNISVVATKELATPKAIESFGINTNNLSEYHFPPQDFVVGNLTISGNTVTTTGYGIRLYDTKNSKVTSNTVKSTSKTQQGVYLSEKSTSNTISSNKIYDFSNGVSLRMNSTGNTVTSNTISTTKSHGILVYEGASASKISSNTITSAGDNAILIKGASATDVNSNVISKSTNHSICVTEKATVKNIKANKISSAGGSAILMKNSTLTEVNSNIINSSKSHGINFAEKCTVTNVKANQVTSAGSNGIQFNSTTISEVNSNIISKAGNHGLVFTNKSTLKNMHSNNVSSSVKGHGIYMDGTCKATSIKSNTLSSNTQFGMSLNNGCTASVYNNTYSKNKKGNAFANGSKSYTFGNLGVPGSVSVSKKSTTATIKWKKVSNATSYQIYRATTKDGTYTKVATVSSSKLSYTNKSLTKKKTYYYKVRALRKMNSVTSYSNYSSIKSIKI